jgi:hypothetical protein
MSNEADFLVESWKVLQEYIPEKDRLKAGEQWVKILQDLGAGEEVFDALSEADDILEDLCREATEEEPFYEDDDEEDDELNEYYD